MLKGCEVPKKEIEATSKQFKLYMKRKDKELTAKVKKLTVKREEVERMMEEMYDLKN